jgi:enoyl-CoA hydratase/carnithine racemase
MIDRGRPSASSPTLSISERRAVIRLNRPEHHNRIEPADVDVLRQILANIEEDDTVHVLVLMGTGTTFCAGYDLRTLTTGEAAGDARTSAPDLREFEQLVDRLERCRVPTVCGLNGPVYGGGADLALACDFRVGIATTRMAVPASQLGVHYYHGGLRRFVTRLGLAAAKRLLLLSQPLDAAELLRVGFLDEIAPTAEALQGRIDAIADTLAAAPVPAVLAGMKRALNRLAEGDMDSGATDAAWAESVRSPAVAVAATERMAARRRVSTNTSEK